MKPYRHTRLAGTRLAARSAGRPSPGTPASLPARPSTRRQPPRDARARESPNDPEIAHWDHEPGAARSADILVREPWYGRGRRQQCPRSNRKFTESLLSRSRMHQEEERQNGGMRRTLHSYRYAWAERAKQCGYPERFAQEALGHNSKAVHRAYLIHKRRQGARALSGFYRTVRQEAAAAGKPTSALSKR